MPTLPTGTVTFLFTDLEGSTRLIQDIGARYAAVLADYRRLLDEAVRERGGVEIGTQGDGCLAAFSGARDGVAAAAAAQQAFVRHAWPDAVSLRVRMGLHTGEAARDAGDYVGLNVNRAARICAAAHGGQILLSEAVHVLTAHDLPPGVSLRDLGPHRLKDLRDPERLYQVVQSGLPADFPPIQSIGPNNLPVQLTSFVGRDQDMLEVKELLLKTRLLTLSGSGGLGKTRLALQLAADIAGTFPDGAWLVELAPLTDPGLIPQAMATLFGLREQPGRPLLTTLTEYLQPRHLLLVLDNSEHLIAGCAQLVDTLLRTCPRLHVLATSRQTLGITGETTWLVPPLSLPEPQGPTTPEHVARYEAVRLFTDRAAAAVPQFSLTPENAPVVAEVCRRLDGIPLAIELAAARLRILSVEQVRQRLDQRFHLLTGGSRTALPRHQTLRAAIDWSYALLSEKERALFRRLAVFVGGCAPEAVEAVCAGGEVPDDDVLELVAQLVDKSLLMADRHGAEVRYRMLDTILEFGRAKLLESEEEVPLRGRHAEFFRGLAEHAEPHLRGPDQVAWLARLETEHDNLRAVLEWSLRSGASDEGLRLAGSLWWFWYVRGYHREGRQRLERVLDRGRDAPPALRAKALMGAGFLARDQGDVAAARASLEQGLELCRSSADKAGTARALFGLGRVELRERALDRAAMLCEEARALFEELGLKDGVGVVLNTLGTIAFTRGDPETARSLFQQSLVINREVGNVWGISLDAGNLGVLALHRGDYEAAGSFLRESLALDRELEDRRGIATLLEPLAAVAAMQRQSKRAARLLGAAAAIRETIGAPMSAHERAFYVYDTCVDAVRAALGREVMDALRAEGRAMTLQEAIEYAMGEDVCGSE